MFVKLTPNEIKVKEWWETLEKCKKETPELGGWDEMKPITEKELCADGGSPVYTGFYIGSDHELYLFDEFSTEPDYFDKFMFFSYDSKYKSQYGVADNPEQIMKHFKREFEDKDRKFVVLVTGFSLEHAESDKFYKQGTYIGECQSRCGFGKGEYNPSKLTEEVKNNGYLIGYHIYPLPGTEPYTSKKYQILKKYVIEGNPFSKGDTKIEIIKHGDGEYWRRNGDVTVQINYHGETKEEVMTVYSLVWLIYNEIYK